MSINQPIIALIPARGGSKAVPHKNIHPLGGKPLIAYSIETALQVSEIDRVIVSTDDKNIGKVAEEYGAEYYKRPAHLATDDSLVIETIEHLIEEIQREGNKPYIMLLLEPTCPFRSKETIRKCITLLSETNNSYSSVATFSEAGINPHRTWKIKDSQPEPFIPGADPWLPRQRLPEAFVLNGAVYAFLIDAFLKISVQKGLLFGKSGAVIIEREEAVDIDNEIDFMVAEAILAKSVKAV